MMDLLNNRIALITGAGRGIGKSIAALFSKNGSKVVIVDKNPEYLNETKQEILDSGGLVDGINADLTDPIVIKDVVQHVKSNYGKLDVLVNNAGIYSTKRLENINSEDWDQVMDINLKTPYFLCQHAIPLLRKSKNGAIINISSLAGQIGGVYASPPYAISKSGLICLTKSLAKYLAKENIRVNAIAPGVIETDMSDNYTEEYINSIPFKRKGKPIEVAYVALFLASYLSSYMTGITLSVNGGTYMG